MALFTQSLNGEWKLKRDIENTGKQAHFENSPLDTEETFAVPGNLNMLEDTQSGVYWYETEFEPVGFFEGKRGYIHFGGVEYFCDVFLNGIYIGSHEGRQTEFTLEATKALKPDTKNRLTVRVVYPLRGIVDGIDSTAVMPLGHSAGGGIYQGVNFSVGGKVHIQSLQAFGNIHTGNIEIDIAVDSDALIEIAVSDKRDGGQRFYKHFEKEVFCGNNRLELPIENPLWWSVESPELYCLAVTVKEQEGSVSERHTLRTGFREFKVDEKGQFCLNGKRIYLKSAHSGGNNSVFYGNVASSEHETLTRWYLTAMKAAGFNCIRYLEGINSKGTLELCDELGIMVYQEHASAWIGGRFPAVTRNEKAQTKEEIYNRFYNTLSDQIKQDRNHISVIAWGLLNETVPCTRYEAAKAALPVVRALDKTRLVLLSSGSWGEDLNGSVCNPFEDSWSCLWGAEGTDFKSEQLFEDVNNRRNDINEKQTFIAGGYYTSSGDVHCYPTAQVTKGHFDWFENLGKGTKPVFISEFGVGSQADYVALARFSENMPQGKEYSRSYILGHKHDRFLNEFIKKHSLEDIYPTPRHVILESYAEQNKYREQVFSLIRSNPNIMGYSMTAVQDHAYRGEGFLGLMGEFKPGHMDTMQEGWAPLRWCILTWPTHFYSDEPVRLRAVLADEDVLKAGTYPVTLRIYGKEGVVWKKELEFFVPEGERGYTHNVFDETVVVEGLKEGQYTFSAVLEKGAWARGGNADFDVTDKALLPKLTGKICIAGEIPENTKKLLEKQGATITGLDDDGIILVGRLKDKAVWDKVYKKIEAGAYAAFTDRWSFTEKGEYYGYLDETYEAVNIRRDNGSKAQLVSNWEWLYHRMAIAKPCKLLNGLTKQGLLDQNYYNEVLSQQYLIFDTPADKEAVLAFEMRIVGAYDIDPLDALIMGENNYGKGRYSFTTLEVLEQTGHPAADKLLLNMLNSSSVEEERAGL